MLRLHALSLQGNGSSPEAAEACAEMEEPWDLMTERERERMRGLSIDLYAIEDGGGPQVEMTPQEQQRWVEQSREAFTALLKGDCDFALQFLRRPSAAGRPRYVVPFLQSRCWERLGDLNVALVFMRESERHDPAEAVFVMALLERTGRSEEALQYARRLLEDSTSSPFVLYQAAGLLVESVQGMPSAEVQARLEPVEPTLRRALQAERALPRNRREYPGTEASIASALGLCLEWLGRTRDALAVYSDGLAHYPNDAELLTLRGTLLYDSAREEALRDLQKAADRGAATAFPCYLLAHAALTGGRFLDCWRLCLQALERPAGRTIQAQLHEWLGISRMMLDQSSV
ncbi:MAG TPA: hypothetical protein VFW33_02095, partial [Gemmataceae bacterium]|nr:hypothetical protein [Gemmataceae bacterium]